MELYRYIAVLISVLLSALLARGQQAECELIQGSDLGTTESPSQQGLIADTYQIGDSSVPPFILLLQYRLTCIAVGCSPNRARYVSVITTYNCTGSIPPGTAAPCSGIIETQFDFECVDLEEGLGSRWILSTLSSESIQSPPDGNFTTPLRIGCSFCVSPTQGRMIGLDVEGETHCAGMHALYTRRSLD